MNNWETKRARFNHDRLKNQFIQSIIRLIRVLQGRIVDKDFIENFVQNILSRWNELESEALELLNMIEKQPIPVAWFQEAPLDQLTLVDRRWMEALLSDKLLPQLDMNQAIQRTYQLVHDVGEKCQAIIEMFRKMQRYGDTDQNDDGLLHTYNAALLQCVFELYYSCQELSDSFQSLARTDDVISIITNRSNQDAHK